MTTDPFDPVAILRELEDSHVSYVLVGTLAGVLHGTGETTAEVVVCPRMEENNLARLSKSLGRLGATDAGEIAPANTDRRVIATRHGPVVLDPSPAGSQGYDDLRRRGGRLVVANGVQVNVAAPEDLLRVLTTGQEPDRDTLMRYQQVIELERSLDLGMSL
jgi:hypothetical protein